MIKNKITIWALGVASVLIAGMFSVGVANAAGSLIYITPNSSNETVGDTFVLTAAVNTAGSNVCAVEGTLRLNNKLSCQSIVMEEGVMAQKAPSCSSPSFLLGFDGCTTKDKILFRVNVKAVEEGAAIAKFTGVDVIGEGYSLSEVSVGGNYTLAVAPVVPVESTQPASQTTPPADTSDDEKDSKPVTDTCACGDWGDWQWDLQNDCGRGGCASSQLLQLRERECDPVSCKIEVENRCVADAYCASMVPVVDNDDSDQKAATGDASGSKTGWLIGGLILLIGIAAGAYFSKKKK